VNNEWRATWEGPMVGIVVWATTLSLFTSGCSGLVELGYNVFFGTIGLFAVLAIVGVVLWILSSLDRH